MMEKIDFKKQNIPFTQVANGVLYDKNLSLGAKAIYAYIYSKPDGWDFASARMAKELKVSKPTVLKHLKELEFIGYLIKKKLPSGRMLYKIIFPPIEPESTELTLGQEPESKKARVKNLHSEESLPISNKEIQVISKNTSNTTEANASEADQSNIFIAEVIKHFEVVNPSCRRMYGNTTQRKACDFLIKEYTFEKVIKVIEILPKTNKMNFMPIIKTPVQLEQKWSQLEDSLIRKKEEINSKKAKVAFVL